MLYYYNIQNHVTIYRIIMYYCHVPCSIFLSSLNVLYVTYSVTEFCFSFTLSTLCIVILESLCTILPISHHWPTILAPWFLYNSILLQGTVATAVSAQDIFKYATEVNTSWIYPKRFKLRPTRQKGNEDTDHKNIHIINI